MKILTLKNAFWPFLLALLTMISYVVISTNFAVNQRIPFAWLFLLLVAVVWSIALLRAKISIPRFVGLLLTVALAALFSWWTLGISEYDDKEEAVDNGDVVAELTSMTLRDHAGLDRPVLVNDGPTLVVLYRGHW